MHHVSHYHQHLEILRVGFATEYMAFSVILSITTKDYTENRIQKERIVHTTVAE